MIFSKGITESDLCLLWNMEIRRARMTGVLKMITLKFLAVVPEWMVMLLADIGTSGRRNHLEGAPSLILDQHWKALMSPKCIHQIDN